MRLLCVDVGSGTQDILLLDTAQRVENAIQLVLPAPTVLVAERIRAATKRGDGVVLLGETMGGGACTQAVRTHLGKGLPAYAVPPAALTFNDNLEEVVSWGVKLISPDEASGIKAGTGIWMADVMLDQLREALSRWGIQLDPDAVAVAVLDHGTSPPGESQRLSRFRHIEGLLSKNHVLESLAFTPADLPGPFTRMQAVARSLQDRLPLVLMDTGAAAVLGASLDRVVAAHPHRLVANLGNSHTIAFLLRESRVLGLFEHHTSRLSLPRLEALFDRLTAGELTLAEVWEEGGHGSLVWEKGANPFIAATGPRRALLNSSRLKPYFPAPFGNMMLTGCYGLALAVASRLTEWRDDILGTLLSG